MTPTTNSAKVADSILNPVLITPVPASNIVKTAKKTPYAPPSTSNNLNRFLEASCDCC